MRTAVGATVAVALAATGRGPWIGVRHDRQRRPWPPRFRANRFPWLEEGRFPWIEEPSADVHLENLLSL